MKRHLHRKAVLVGAGLVAVAIVSIPSMAQA
jgi:hypothetical protein